MVTETSQIPPLSETVASFIYSPVVSKYTDVGRQRSSVCFIRLCLNLSCCSCHQVGTWYAVGIQYMSVHSKNTNCQKCGRHLYMLGIIYTEKGRVYQAVATLYINTCNSVATELLRVLVPPRSLLLSLCCLRWTVCLSSLEKPSLCLCGPHPHILKTHPHISCSYPIQYSTRPNPEMLCSCLPQCHQ